jgi:hypothetical protein
MNRFFRTTFIFVGVLLSVLTGCNRDPGPPPPIAVEQIPAEMQKAFAKAPSETREIVTQLNNNLEKKDYPAAYVAVQSLVNLPVATKEQRAISLRASLALNGLLQTAQAQGDKQATEVLTMQKRMK